MSNVAVGLDVRQLVEVPSGNHLALPSREGAGIFHGPSWRATSSGTRRAGPGRPGSRRSCRGRRRCSTAGPGATGAAWCRPPDGTRMVVVEAHLGSVEELPPTTPGPHDDRASEAISGMSCQRRKSSTKRPGSSTRWRSGPACSEPRGTAAMPAPGAASTSSGESRSRTTRTPSRRWVDVDVGEAQAVHGPTVEVTLGARPIGAARPMALPLAGWPDGHVRHEAEGRSVSRCAVLGPGGVGGLLAVLLTDAGSRGRRRGPHLQRWRRCERGGFHPPEPGLR